MGGDATIGNLYARLVADSGEFDAALKASEAQMASTGAAAEKMAAKVVAAGTQQDREAKRRETQIARMRAAFQREQYQQMHAEAAAASLARKQQMGALQADILARSARDAAAAQSELAASSDAAAGSGMRLQNSLGLVDNAMRGQTSRALADMVRGMSRFSVVMDALPWAAAVAGLYIVGRLAVEGAEKFFGIGSAADAARAKLVADWEDVDRALADTNESLRLSNARMGEAILDLQETPGDGLTTALLEAADAAQKFGERIDEDLSKLQKLMLTNKVSALAEMAGDQRGDISRTVGFAVSKYQEIAPQYEDVMQRAAQRGDWPNFKQARAAEIIALQGAMGPEFDTLGDYLKKHQIGPGEKESAQHREARLGYEGIADLFGALSQQAQQEQQEHTKAALTAKGRRLAASGTAARELMPGWRRELETEEAYQGKSVGLEVSFWSAKVRAARQGTAAYVQAMNAYQEAVKPLTGPLMPAFRKSQEMQQTLLKLGPPPPMYPAQQRGAERLTAAQVRGQMQDAQSAWRYAQEWYRLQVQAGVISPAAGAVGTAAAHSAALAAQIRALTSELQQARQQARQQAGLSAVLGPNPAMQAKIQALQNEIAQTQAQARLYSLRDRMAIEDAAYQMQAGTGLGGLRDALHQLATSTNAGQFVGGSFTGGLQSVNQALITQMTTPANMLRGRHLWGNTGGQIFSGVAGSALQLGESKIAQMFGFGQKKLMTKGNPGHVIVDKLPGMGSGSSSSAIQSIAGALSSSNSSDSSSGGSSGSSGGGWLGQIMGAIFGGMQHRALGGPLMANMPAIVGERGPEMFVPATAGHIVPNNRLGGTVTHHHHYNVNVDARGAGDPAAVEAAGYRGAMTAAPLIERAVRAKLADDRRRLPRLAR